MSHRASHLAGYGTQDEAEHPGEETSDNDGAESEDQDDDENDEDGDDDDDDGDSGYAESDEVPPYSIAEITNRFLSFYKFLTKLHYNASDLREPPPEGWSDTPDPDGEDTLTGKSSLVRSVLKHLPYFSANAPAQLHHKCRIVDFSNYASKADKITFWDDYFSDISEWDDPPVYPGDILVFAEGYESSGSSFVLVPKKGHIFQECCGGRGTAEAVDIMTFFDDMQSQFEKLELIGAPSKVLIEAPSSHKEWEEPPWYFVPEADREITHEEVLKNMETEDRFENRINIQYLRQMFRKHGWPDRFDREAAQAELKKWEDEYTAKDKTGWENDN